ncbi:MAG: hypothetical protein R3D63_06795 [Paracoccaceae bacterium]
MAEIAAADGARFIACFYAGVAVPESTAFAFAADRLARYKQPRAFVHLTALPRGPTGKVNRRALVALYPKGPA